MLNPLVANLVCRLTFAAVLLGGQSSALAQVIDFDTGLPYEGAVPAGYAGLTWNNFDAAYTGASGPSGYVNGTVSPDFVIFNGYGDPASFSKATAFTFNSVYLTAAWQDGLNVVVDAYAGSSLVHSASFTLDTYGPTLKTFNWSNIDSVTFTTNGGVRNPLYGSVSGTQLVMDNLTISAVPEPETYALFLSGLGLMGLLARWRESSMGE